jgi:hypothetical protein
MAVEEEVRFEYLKDFFYIVIPIILIIGAFLLSYSSIAKKYLKLFEKAFSELAKKRRLSVLFVFLVTFLSVTAIGFFIYMPKADIHDEFSYLLAADTFAQGRLTNPPHVMWKHFETFHVLQQPTYASKYPPGQGLILAFGQILAGDPVFGLWLSIAIACAAICWMLQAWMPPKWALFGSLLMVLKIGLFSYWSNTFWGGAVAATGGAILFGSMRRIMRKPITKNALYFGLGLAILANSRPFEGLIISLPTIAVLIFWVVKKSSCSFREVFSNLVLPLGIMLSIVGIFMGYYNYVVTGKFWVMPFDAYERVYSNLSNFIWVTPTAKIVYNHEEFRLLYDWWFASARNSNLGFANYINSSISKISLLAKFYIDIIFGLVLAVLPLLLKNRWVQFALFCCLFLLLGLLQVVIVNIHYFAPATCLIYFLIVQCLRRIYRFKLNKKPIGLFLSWSVLFYCILLVVFPLFLRVNPYIFVTFYTGNIERTSSSYWTFKREEIIKTLKAEDGNHLIIVKYEKGHNMVIEWVYNEANIDSARIVWARNLTPKENCQLAKYFYDRKIWLLEIDKFQNITSLRPFNPCQ